MIEFFLVIEFFLGVKMEKFTNMRLEYLKLENNLLTHKRQYKQHTINKQELEDAYKTFLVFESASLEKLNADLDDMGLRDLNNYEKWLVDVREEYY